MKLTFHISKEHVYLFCQPSSMTTRLPSTVGWQRLTRCSPNPLPLLGDMAKRYLLVLRTECAWCNGQDSQVLCAFPIHSPPSRGWNSKMTAEQDERSLDPWATARRNSSPWYRLQCEGGIKSLKFWECLIEQLVYPNESFHCEGSM